MKHDLSMRERLSAAFAGVSVTSQRWADCLRKARFETQVSARRRAHQIGKHVYQCRHCGDWHLTSKRKRGQS